MPDLPSPFTVARRTTTFEHGHGHVIGSDDRFFAVWPEDAEIDLRQGSAQRAVVRDLERSIGHVHWIGEAFRAGSRGMAWGMTDDCTGCAKLSGTNDGRTWKRVEGVPDGANEIWARAVIDIDHDGEPEAIVHEMRGTHGGYSIFTDDDWTKPAHRFDCGK